jgi:transcriptional regulator with XRE-family HTH domain
MIRSEAEYKDAVARSRKSAERLVEYRDELRARGMSPDEVEKVVGSMVSIHDDLCVEVGRYERFKKGDLSDCKTLREVGPLLIAARLARGLTQRDLADKLGVHESQVSRDEKNEYQGISLERAVQVLEVLSVDLEIRPSLRPDREGGGVGNVGESESIPHIDDWAGLSEEHAASPLK